MNNYENLNCYSNKEIIKVVVMAVMTVTSLDLIDGMRPGKRKSSGT